MAHGNTFVYRVRGFINPALKSANYLMPILINSLRKELQDNHNYIAIALNLIELGLSKVSGLYI